MAVKIVRENGLLIARQDEGGAYRVWNKLHQKDVDTVYVEHELAQYFENCLPNVLPEELFGALWDEVCKCYPRWFRMFSKQITSMITENAFEYHLIQMAVVGPEFIRFFYGGEEIFKIKMHREHEGLMTFLSARNISLYSAKADSFFAWTLDMERHFTHP